MHYWNDLWNSLDSVRKLHSDLELWAIVFFILLVAADTVAHRYEEKHPIRSRRFAGIGLWVFAIAVLMELVAYPFGQRNDTLASQQDANQRAEIAKLDNSTQQLRTDADNAKAQIADADARARTAEAQVASAKAESKAASAKAESFRLEIAKANESARQAEARAAEANLELARFKAPRTLSPTQQATIANQLRKFGAMRVDVIIIGDAQEIANITGLIIAAIQQAGWNVTLIGKAISGPNVSGVFVGTHLNSDQNVVDASKALIAGLNSAGIATEQFAPQFNDELPMALMGNWDKNNIAPIRILVSAKP
jgi:hypothetical protein